MQFEKKSESAQINYKPDCLKPLIIGVVVIPISLMLWVCNVLSSHYLIEKSKILL